MVKTLYVGNISWSTTEEELKELFEEYGSIQACRIITERGTGRSRGYGFIEVNDEKAEIIIEELNGAEFGGRKLVVSEAKSRERQR